MCAVNWRIRRWPRVPSFRKRVNKKEQTVSKREHLGNPKGSNRTAEMTKEKMHSTSDRSMPRGRVLAQQMSASQTFRSSRVPSRIPHKVAAMGQDCNHTPWEVEEGGSDIQGYFSLNSECEPSLGLVRLCLGGKREKKRRVGAQFQAGDSPAGVRR